MSKNRKLILESARELFSNRNFDQVTIKEICAHAGVANSTFYYHFKTKEELVYGLRAQNEAPLHNELLNLMLTPNLLEQVIAVCMIRAARAEQHGFSITAQYYRSIIGKELESDDLADDHRKEDDMVRMLIERAQQEGVIDSRVSAEVLMNAATRLTRCVIFDWCASGAAFDLRAEVRRMLLGLFGVEEE